MRSHDRSLIAYAFLAQASRGEGDLLDGLAPIFKPVAKLYQGQRFDPKQFTTTLAEMYGLRISPWAAEDLAPRLERAGLLAKVGVSERAHEYVYADVKQTFDEVTEHDIAAIVQRFKEFAIPVLQQLGTPIREDLEDGFLRELINMEFVGILLKPEQVARASRGPATLTLGKAAEQGASNDEKAAKSRFDVLCAAFVLDTFHKDKPLYELIVRVATGALISEVILNFQDPGDHVSLSGLTVILDTPFLMSAVDLSSEESYVLASAMCEQLREHGAKLAVFSHSVDELKDNLAAVVGYVSAGGGFGATARRLRNATFHAYATAILQAPEPRLRQSEIAVIKPPASDASHQYFTGEDEQRLIGRLGYYENRVAQERDAASIAAVVRMRRNIRAKMGHFPRALYVFLTGNPWLAERSRTFMTAASIYAEDEVPPAFVDRYLAGLLWVLYGGKAGELPQHVLLANCAAVVEPRSDVIRQMHTFLEEVEPRQAEYFRALLTEERAGQYLMQLTLGDSALVTSDNALAILEQIKGSLVEEHEVRKAAEINAIKAEHQERLAREQQVADKLNADLLEARAKEMKSQADLGATLERVTQLETLVDHEKSARLRERQQLIEKCARQALRSTKRAQILLSLLVGLVAMGLTWLSMRAANSDGVKLAAALAMGLVVFLGFWKVPDLLFEGMMNRRRDNVYRKRLSFYGLESSHAQFRIDWKTGSALVVEDHEE
jgi:hypothetical protein